MWRSRSQSASRLSRRFFILEFVAEEETTLRNEITRQQITCRDGYLDVPCEPGLGVELNEEALEKYRVA